jgi:uncharacterized protein (TIGR00255 family)
MTGYAQAQVIENGWSLRVSVRSVNHRFLDLHLRVPEGFEPVEPRIRQIVRERVRRGHLDVTLHYDPAGPAAVGVNREVAAAYLQAVNSLRKEFGIETQPDLAAILRLPGVIGPAAASIEEELGLLETAVTRCLVESLDKLDRMREQEGNHLREEMSARLPEMPREANMLLSKPPGSEAEGLEITRRALQIKSEIEKLREQVQNIE